MSELLTIDDVAAMLQVSRRTIERLVRAGRLRVVEVSPRVRRVERRELEAFVATARATRYH